MLPQGVACKKINQTIDCHNINQSFDCKSRALFGAFIEGSGSVAASQPSCLAPVENCPFEVALSQNKGSIGQDLWSNAWLSNVDCDSMKKLIPITL
jgi:hypothetical protein